MCSTCFALSIDELAVALRGTPSMRELPTNRCEVLLAERAYQGERLEKSGNPWRHGLGTRVAGGRGIGRHHFWLEIVRKPLQAASAHRRLAAGRG